MTVESEDVMQTGAADVGNMEAELLRWSAKLTELRAKTPAAGRETKFDYRKRVDDMTEKYEAAEQKLGELKAAGSANWDSFRSGVESAWSDLAAAYQKLAN